MHTNVELSHSNMEREEEKKKAGEGKGKGAGKGRGTEHNVINRKLPKASRQNSSQFCRRGVKPGTLFKKTYSTPPLLFYRNDKLTWSPWAPGVQPQDGRRG